MKNFLSRFYFWRSQKDKIEDPRSAEQIGTKLVGWREQRTDFAERRFNEESAREKQLSAEILEAQKRRMREEEQREIPLPTEPVEKSEKNQE